ncbi:MAG: T9SS type A sorting domain-containing protein [Bacteroidota bacterium]|nr:T9SS type A sorting domain-containing protein [Bacteroidota bacterium]
MKNFRSARWAAFVLALGVGTVIWTQSRTHSDKPISSGAQLAEVPKGHPDRYFAYHRDIRRPTDGRDSYTVGYRIREFEEARKRAKGPGKQLNWTEIGPGNVGGRTRALLLDPDDPTLNTIWAGSVSGGLWKSVDGGERWLPQTDDLPNLAVSSLAMAESNPDIIYMGTGEGMAGAGGVAGDGIFKSYDRGKTWTHLSFTSGTDEFKYVNRLAVDPEDPDVVVAATDHGILRSADGGEYWELVYSGYAAVQDLQAQPGNFATQIAGEHGMGMLVSTDAGVTWNMADNILIDRAGRIELAYSPSHPNTAYAVVDGQIGAQLYSSDDGGLSWLPTTEPTNYNWLGGQGWFDNTIAVHPFDPNTVFVGGIRLWRTQLTGDRAAVPTPGDLDLGGTDSWLAFATNWGAAFNGKALYRHHLAVDVAVSDYSNIEIRFGQGSQKAHRFWVAETAGFYGNGGSDVSLYEYRYADYVEVPFQVWDTDNQRQLMVSFRDQAEDGSFDLKEYHVTTVLGTRDEQSHELLFIHKYDYDDVAPHNLIANDASVVRGMLYGMWPVLASGAAWDPANLPNQTVTLEYVHLNTHVRRIDGGIDRHRNIHVDHHGILPVAIDEVTGEFWVFNANDGGVAVSKDNGETFVELDNPFSGYNTSQVYGVAKAPGLPRYIAGFQDNGTYLSYAAPIAGRGWRHVGGGDGVETVWHSSDDDKILITTQYGGVIRTVSGGGRWDQVRPFDQRQGLFVTSIDASDLAPDDVYLVKRDGVWRSRDFGLNWSLFSLSDFGGWQPWDGCKVRVSLADPDVVWAGCGLGGESNRTFFVSKDRGTSFSPVFVQNTIGAPGAISGLATHPYEAGTAYAIFSSSGAPKILKTDNFGQTWVDLSAFHDFASTNGFPNVAVYDLVVMPHATDEIWAGTEIGLFISKNGGDSWEYADNGLPPVSVWRMKIRDEELVVGTHGRGVWTLPLSEISVGTEQVAHEVPSEFRLDQNYPNPFNATTTIAFTVPRQSQIRLAVFDALGRQVAELTDQGYESGRHLVSWQAGAQASGTYFYRLTSDGRLVQTRTMTLVK